MSDLTCEYHPHRQAVEKCERCHRMICLKDKMLHERWVGDTENRHLIKMTVCPLCHHDFQIESRFKSKNVTLAMIIFFTFILIVSIIITTSQVNSDQESYEWQVEHGFIRPGGVAPEDKPVTDRYQVSFILFTVFSIISFLVIAYGFPEMARKSEEKVYKARKSKEEFLKSIKEPSIQEKYRTATLTCFECGSSIEMTDMFCLNCGDDTVDEMKAHIQ